MLSKPPECSGCCLEKTGRGFTRVEGTGHRGLVALLEAPGYEEMRDGLPVRPHAQAGSKFEEIIALAGVPGKDFLITNVIRCQPPGNELRGASYEYEAIQHCRCHFRDAISSVNRAKCDRRVFIAFGAIPTGYLVSGDTSISSIRGFVHDSEYGLVVPTFHPSFVKRGNPELTPLVAFDVQRAVEVAEGRFTNYPAYPDYEGFHVLEEPSEDQAWAFYYRCRDNANLSISFDIETPKSGWVQEEERGTLEDASIIQIQFAVGNKWAIVFPWQAPYTEIAAKIMALSNVKAGHYVYQFDVGRLTAAGMKIHGRILDTLWMFKHWNPRLPRGLQNVAAMAGFPHPWKYAFEEKPAWYGGCDVIAVQYILRWLPPLMRKLGIWDGFMEEITSMYSILQYRPDGETAAQRGMPVNPRLHEELKKQLLIERREKHRQLQKLIPDEIKNLEPKRKDKRTGALVYGYVKPPKKLLKQVQDSYLIYKEKGGELDIWAYLAGLTLKTKPKKDGKQDEFRLVKREFEDGSVRWCRLMAFKASQQQLVRYIKYKRRALEEG